MLEDRYEWENVAKNPLVRKYFGRIVFIRDLSKMYYLEGINNKVNSIDELCNLVMSLTEGMIITTCGSSAGGFAATVVGRRLGAERIFSFSGQFNLSGRTSFKDGPSELLKMYGDALADMASESLVFYFYPFGSADDCLQYNYVKDISYVRSFAIDTIKHGDTLRFDAFPYVITKKMMS